jgi:hypothetical protein
MSVSRQRGRSATKDVRGCVRVWHSALQHSPRPPSPPDPAPAPCLPPAELRTLEGLCDHSLRQMDTGYSRCWLCQIDAGYVRYWLCQIPAVSDTGYCTVCQWAGRHRKSGPNIGSLQPKGSREARLSRGVTCRGGTHSDRPHRAQTATRSLPQRCRAHQSPPRPPIR